MMFNRPDAVTRYGRALAQERKGIADAFISGQASAHQTADALAILMDETRNPFGMKLGPLTGLIWPIIWPRLWGVWTRATGTIQI